MGGRRRRPVAGSLRPRSAAGGCRRLQRSAAAAVVGRGSGCQQRSTLVAELCHSRALISIALDGSVSVLVKCFVPLERLWPSNGLPDSIAVQNFPVDNSIHHYSQHGTYQSLITGGAERLAEACNREQWLVNQMEIYKWFDLSHQSFGSWRPRLQNDGSC